MDSANFRQPVRTGRAWPTGAVAVTAAGFCIALGLSGPGVTTEAAGLVAGQDSGKMRSVWDGVYTEEQAGRGRRLFQGNCGDCHQPAEFKAGYETAYDLFLSKDSMPQTAPGSLGAQEYADLITYIFEEAGFPAGKEEMKGEEEVLKHIKIEAEKPAGQ